MTLNPGLGPVATAAARTSAKTLRPAGISDVTKPVFPRRRAAKYAIGVMLLAVGALVTYQNVIVQTSRRAVINAPIIRIAAPMDGIVKIAPAASDYTIVAATQIGRIENPHPNDTRVFSLQQQAEATQRERDALAGRVLDLKRSRAQADAQAAAYQAGRVRQDEARIAEAQANLAVAEAREAMAADTVRRGTLLRQRGVLSDQAYERARDVLKVSHNETLAAQGRLDVWKVDLAAARKGTYLGDNYNDVPSSFQRARELSTRIAEARTMLDRLVRKSAAIGTQLAVAQRRLAARSVVALTAPIAGKIWKTNSASGNYVYKGQDLFSILDCRAAFVTASVSERVYNSLQIGEPVRFRVAGTDREYSGAVAGLGLPAGDGNFAIPPETGVHDVAISVPGLRRSAVDKCAIGRTGEVVFEGAGSGTTSHFMGFAGRLLQTLRRSLAIG